MDHRQRIVAAVLLTFMITVSVGFLTEYIRESMTFSWSIEEGDQFMYDVSVTGITTTGTTDLPPPFVEMNNTRIHVEVMSLPNVSIVFYSDSFIDNIVDYEKTSSQFANGTTIPLEFRYGINSHISRCLLPIGGWSHLDNLFPNQIRLSHIEHETYLSVHLRTSFFFGYSSNDSYDVHKWQAIIDVTTGIPMIVWFYFYRPSQPWSYWYNVTLSLVI
ncbi:MAG: hypothetical protein ACFFE2_02370 [Candidatus Thorarchaeota archaeon]